MSTLSIEARNRFMSMKDFIVRSPKFGVSEWRNLGVLTNQYQYIDKHQRLFWSLRFGDDDYEGCAIQALMHIVNSQTDGLLIIEKYLSENFQYTPSFGGVISTGNPKSIETGLFRYEIKESLGEGGNAFVKKVIRNADGKSFAAKILKKEAMSKQDKVKRFTQEIAFLLSNRHDNLIWIVESGKLTDDSLFYLMDVADCTLRQAIENFQNWSDERLCGVVADILDGIAFLHNKGIVHRDLKPENILMFGDRAVICDVGIAHFNEEDLITTIVTKEGARAANFQYAAPEQCQKGVPVTSSADVYALALIIIEMITGEFVRGTNRKTIASVRPKFAVWDSILDQARSNSPDNRPKDAVKLKAALFEAISDRTAIVSAIEEIKAQQRRQYEHWSDEESGEVEFDFTKNDGKYEFYILAAKFKTRWSRRGADSVYIYRVEGSIGLKEGLRELPEVIGNISNYDWTTNHAHDLHIDEVVLIANSLGDILAVKILALEDVERGSKRNSLKLRYYLLQTHSFQ